MPTTPHPMQSPGRQLQALAKEATTDPQVERQCLAHVLESWLALDSPSLAQGGRTFNAYPGPPHQTGSENVYLISTPAWVI